LRAGRKRNENILAMINTQGTFRGKDSQPYGQIQTAKAKDTLINVEKFAGLGLGHKRKEKEALC
jgi:hypothetical protein